LPTHFEGSRFPNFVRKAKEFCPGCLVVEITAYESDKDCVAELAKHEAFAEWPLLIAVDNLAKALASEASFLWTTFTRFEPAADIYARETNLLRFHPSLKGPIAIDARIKPWYPKELFCDDDTAKLVNKRWNEYFPNQNVVMGCSDTGHLE
jgi:hypothetical protein